MTGARGREICVSAALILDEEARLLVVRKRGTSVFMQPGGKPEPGENAAETLVRELSEELGLAVSLDQLRPLGEHRAAAANERGFEVVAEVFEIDSSGLRPRVLAEIEELRWLSAADAAELGESLAPLVRTHFLDRLR